MNYGNILSLALKYLKGLPEPKMKKLSYITYDCNFIGYAYNSSYNRLLMIVTL